MEIDCRVRLEYTVSLMQIELKLCQKFNKAITWLTCSLKQVAILSCPTHKGLIHTQTCYSVIWSYHLPLSHKNPVSVPKVVDFKNLVMSSHPPISFMMIMQSLVIELVKTYYQCCRYIGKLEPE